MSSFGAGMSLADGYNVSGGDHAPGGLVLALVSLAALCLIVLVATRCAHEKMARSSGQA